MKSVMISQPMTGKTDEEIIQARSRAIELLMKQGYRLLNTFFRDRKYEENRLAELGVLNVPLYLLAHSLDVMSQSDVVYFCKGWEETRGCRLEHDAAKAYGVKIVYEE